MSLKQNDEWEETAREAEEEEQYIPDYLFNADCLFEEGRGGEFYIKERKIFMVDNTGKITL